MNIQVYPHRIILNKTNEVNTGEYNVNECTFEFSQEYEGLTKVAVFSLCDGTTKNVTILNNQCIIPVECLQETGQVQIGVYGYATQDNELVLRYSPTPQNFVVRLGSYKEGTQPVAPTPTDWEILVEQVSDIAEDVSSIHEDITGINGEINGINIDIRDLKDTKANINDLAAVAFTGEFSDLKNIPSYATTQQLNQEIQDRQDADVNLQSQIDAISVSSDVVDVVGTYQELLDYDTQHLKDNDIVKVLLDSTHNDALSYYRWDKETSTWSYVGSEGPFYTKSETDTLLNDKQDVIDIDNMLSSDLVDDTNSTNKFVTQADITNWNNKEDKSNKVTSISSSSTDTQYPSAKCVYDSQEEQNEHIAELEMLYNAFPTVSDEDTTIELNNTAKVKFREIDLKGNTGQVVIPEEQGTIVSNTSINVSDVNTDKEHTIEMSGNTYQETTSISGGDEYDSPSPDHPQPIQVVTGTNNIEVCGKNLFDKNATLYNGYIASTSPYDLKSSVNSKTLYLKIEPNTTYTISKTASTYFRTGYTNEFPTTGVIVNGLDISAPSSKTITTGTNAEYLVCTFWTNNDTLTVQEILDTIMIEKGSTATTYEQYQGNTYPINLGNIELCKIGTYQDRIYKRNNKWYLEKNINSYTFNGQENFERLVRTGVIVFKYSGLTDIFKTQSQISILSNYLRGSIDNQGNLPNTIRSNNGQLVFMTIPDTNPISDSDTAFKSWLSTHNMVTKYILQTPTTTEITDTNLVNQLNALYNATIYPTTNINTDTSNLLPYIDLHYNFVTPSPSPSRPSVVNVVKGNNTITISNSDNTESQVFPINIGDMELCKIGTYQDYIYESNGNWYKKGNIGKVVLDGVGNYYTRASATDGYRYIYTNSASEILKPSSSSVIGSIMSNKFIAISADSTYNSINGIGIASSGNVVMYYDQIKNYAIDEFKTWLSTNNVLVYYALATPTDTQITDTTLITQLNNIKKAYSYDTQTNISQTNTDKPFIIYAEAIRSLKDVFE